MTNKENEKKFMKWFDECIAMMKKTNCFDVLGYWFGRAGGFVDILYYGKGQYAYKYELVKNTYDEQFHRLSGAYVEYKAVTSDEVQA